MTELERRIKSRWAIVGIRTLDEFCQKVSISDNSMRLIFKREDCKLSLLLRMCDVLNCSLYDLTGR